MKNPGKAFEEDWKKSVPENMYYYRFRDGTANFEGGKNENVRFQQSNICDNLIYIKPILSFLELKSYTGKSLPYTAFSTSAEDEKKKYKKVLDLVDAQEHGILSGYVINLRDIEETYYLSAQKVWEHIRLGERKSIPVNYMRENGYLIKAEKKHTRWRYDVEDMIKQVN